MWVWSASIWAWLSLNRIFAYPAWFLNCGGHRCSDNRGSTVHDIDLILPFCSINSVVIENCRKRNYFKDKNARNHYHQEKCPPIHCLCAYRVHPYFTHSVPSSQKLPSQKVHSCIDFSCWILKFGSRATWLRERTWLRMR